MNISLDIIDKVLVLSLSNLYLEFNVIKFSIKFLQLLFVKLHLLLYSPEWIPVLLIVFDLVLLLSVYVILSQE